MRAALRSSQLYFDAISCAPVAAIFGNLQVTVVTIKEPAHVAFTPAPCLRTWLSPGPDLAIAVDAWPSHCTRIAYLAHRDTHVSYMTVHSSCARLVDSGVLKRRRVALDEAPERAKQAYVYIPRLTQAELLQQAQIEPTQPASPQLDERETIEQLLAYLGTLPDGQQACQLITSLLERVERSERAALVYQAEAARALHRANLAEQLSAQPETPGRRARPIPSTAIYEYPGQERICRVCGRPAPPPPPHRQDGLRVCALESCRQEARRRDNVAKQRRCVARKRAQQIAEEA